jgi:PKHD-type hydroxylase
MDLNYTFPLDLDKPVNQTNYYWFEEGFSPEELAFIEQQVLEIPFQQGVTEGGSQDQGDGLEARNSMVKWIPFTMETKWIYDKIGELAMIANRDVFNFKLSHMPEQIQYTEYYGTNKGHYDWHMDIGTQGFMKFRKISVTVQLSGPEEYEGGDLQLWTGGQYPMTAPKGKGNVVIFPSFMMHRVTPVSSGTRKSFVLWLGGGHYE